MDRALFQLFISILSSIDPYGAAPLSKEYIKQQTPVYCSKTLNFQLDCGKLDSLAMCFLGE